MNILLNEKKEKENEINLLNEEKKKLENEIKNLNQELTKNNNKFKENENNKSQSEAKMNNLINENKSLKGKNLLLLQENTILKSVKNEFEKFKKNKETKSEKIQYLIETNNFNFFYNNQNNRTNKNIPKFYNLKINSSISLSFILIPKNSETNKENSNQENETFKNNYDKDEEINESELNLFDDDNEENNNINYDEINEDMNQEAYNDNELYINYENDGDKNIKKKRKRKRRKKNKSQINKDIINIKKEQNQENIKLEIKNNNSFNDTNKSHQQLSPSQKKKNKVRKKIDNMKSDYLNLLEEKEVLQKENEQQKSKIKELELVLNPKNLDNNNINIINLSRQEKENKEKIDNEDIILQLNEKILEKEMIIDELTESLSKTEKEYKLSVKQIISMQNQISNFEKNIGIDEQLNNMKSLLSQKEEEIIILTEQIKEYQSKCDDIIIGNSPEEKDEQIKLLLNEVKSIRNKIQNILSFEGRINNFGEFMNVISKIIKYLEDSENEDIKILCEKLKFLGENYELNGQKFYNIIMQEIFGINYEEFEDEGNNDNNYELTHEKNDKNTNNNVEKINDT